MDRRGRRRPSTRVGIFRGSFPRDSRPEISNRTRSRRPRRGQPSWRRRFMRSRGQLSIPEAFSRLPPPPSVAHEEELSNEANKKLEELCAVLPAYHEYFNKKIPVLPNVEEKIRCTEEFLRRNHFGTQAVNQQILDENTGESFYEVDIQDCLKDECIASKWPDISEDLINLPDDVISLWGATAYKIVTEKVSKMTPSREPPQKISLTKIGFKGISKETGFVNIRAETLGKYIAVSGVIVKTAVGHLHCHRLSFKCNKCGSVQAVKQPQGVYTYPTRCIDAECLSSKPVDWTVIEDDCSTRICRSKRIHLQENLNNMADRNVMPRTLECQLFGDLVDLVAPGEAVSMSGILRMHKDANQKRMESLHQAYLEVYSVTQLRENNRTLGGNLFQISEEDHRTIQEISKRPNLFRILTNSIAPAIIGHELVKAGLIFSMFGGTSQSGASLNRRADINVLIVGEMGLGKSKLLKFIHEAAPKSVFVSGSNASSAGMGCTLVRDNDTWVIEPGALILSDLNLLLIDEFDKMSKVYPLMLEAMEQQSLSLAKCSTSRSFNTRSTIIAVANPIGGIYDRCKPLERNVKMNHALLSRFDIIYTLKNSASASQDKRVTESMFQFESQDASYSTALPTRSISLQMVLQSQQSLLSDRLKLLPEEKSQLIPPEMLRKYIAYAKFHCHPELSNDAKDLLKRYYLHIRLTGTSQNASTVTFRALESLIRLAQARCKLEMREEVTLQDVEDIIELFDWCKEMQKECEAPTTYSRHETVSRSAVRLRKPSAKLLLEKLQDLSSILHKRTFSTDEIKILCRDMSCLANMEAYIDRLCTEGFMIKKSAKVYELLGIF